MQNNNNEVNKWNNDKTYDGDTSLNALNKESDLSSDKDEPSLWKGMRYDISLYTFYDAEDKVISNIQKNGNTNGSIKNGNNGNSTQNILNDLEALNFEGKIIFL